jgi:hypothetical protein
MAWMTANDDPNNLVWFNLEYARRIDFQTAGDHVLAYVHLGGTSTSVTITGPERIRALREYCESRQVRKSDE